MGKNGPGNPFVVFTAVFYSIKPWILLYDQFVHTPSIDLFIVNFQSLIQYIKGINKTSAYLKG